MKQFDPEFERQRLTMLTQQYPSIVRLNGSITFCADQHESRLKSTSWIFNDDALEVINHSHFKLHLIELLDSFIQYREQSDQLPNKEGVIRITDGKLTIEWLPDNSTQRPCRYSTPLLAEYETILNTLNINAFDTHEDRYSGVFLPVPFDEYWYAPLKVMLIGRETAGWNTHSVPPKNTIQRVADFSDKNNMPALVNEAIERYKQHLRVDKHGNVITKDRSRFKQYFFKLARELNIEPNAIVYSNLFAWDYHKKSPRSRPLNELNEISSLSKQLLAAQINYLKPDVIIFATGFAGIDPIIKALFKEHFNSYESQEVIPKKYWKFNAANATCFRIAHPRATGVHSEFRDKVIQSIKETLLP